MILVVTAVATLGALLVATANSYAMVLVGRALEGTLLALIPLVYSLMRDIFPRRILAFSVTIAASGVGIVTICGPFIAGYLVDNHGWQSVFWFLFVEQLVGLIAILFVIPESPVRQRVRLDWAGAILLGGGLGVILLGVSQGSAWGWTRRADAGLHPRRRRRPGALGRDRRGGPTEPLMDLTVLRSRSVSDDPRLRDARPGRAGRRCDDAADPRTDAARARHRLWVRCLGDRPHAVHRSCRGGHRRRRLPARCRHSPDGGQDPVLSASSCRSSAVSGSR